ncbi:MAG: HAD-IIIA family hydrolase [Rhodospirillales bacterium]|nr:HAD-IIIA family hydrolase [Rhodospirillales bacterium]
MQRFPIDGTGVWRQLLRPAEFRHDRPSLFLDRDGVIVEEVGYLCRTEDVRLTPSAADVIAAANRAGTPVIVVSNQSGIGRGRFTWQDFSDVQDRIIARLADGGAALDAVLACPHHAHGQPPYDHADHPARKPNPGMILAAATMLPIDLSASWIVGDRASDLAAGRAAGLAGGVHVLTGHGGTAGERSGALSLARNDFAVAVATSIADAMEIVHRLSGRQDTGSSTSRHETVPPSSLR